MVNYCYLRHSESFSPKTMSNFDKKNNDWEKNLPFSGTCV